jgi:MoaA/NifB/PqqE/SkfB family radical SAM enzyme
MVVRRAPVRDGQARRKRLRQGTLRRAQPRAGVRLLAGAYPPEQDGSGRFTWTRPDFLLEVTGAPRGRKVLRLDLENLIGPGTVLSIEDADGRPLDRLRLDAGRQLHHVTGLPVARAFTLRLRCAGRVPEALHPGDDRDLALKLYDLSIHPTRTAREVLESDCWALPAGQLDAFTVELTTGCNLKCLICPQVADRPFRPRHMTPELLERMLPWSAQAATVALHGVGEPLLFPGIADVVRRLEPHGPRVFFSTNGTVMTDEHLEVLLGGQVREVSFSLDAATPETFRRMRGANFETVLRNIRRLVAGRRARSLAHPQVSLNMTLTQANLDEAPLFVDLAAELAADAVWLWHLNHDYASNDWTVKRDGFVFDYRSQNALADPARAARVLGEAHRRARERGVHFHPDHSRRYAAGESAPVEENRLRDFRPPYRDLQFSTDGRARLGCFQNEYFTRTRIQDLPPGQDPRNSEEHRVVRYLLAHDRVPASFRGAGHKHLEGTSLLDALTGVFVVGRHRARASGLREDGGESPLFHLPFAWTTGRVEVEVPWEPGREPLAAQLFLHTPDEAPRAGRLLVEDRVVYEGPLPAGTWSRDVLLDADLGAALAGRAALRLTLETGTDAASRGVGLIALAVV